MLSLLAADLLLSPFPTTPLPILNRCCQKMGPQVLSKLVNLGPTSHILRRPTDFTRSYIVWIFFWEIFLSRVGSKSRAALA